MIKQMEEAEEAIADLVDAMEAYGGEPPESLEEVFKPEVNLKMITMMMMLIGGAC